MEPDPSGEKAHVTVALKKGLELQKSEKREEAEALYREIASWSPETAEVWNRLGAICFETNRFQESLEYLQRAKDLDPRDPVFHSNYGGVLLSINRFEDASVCFARAAALKPQEPDYHYYLGYSHELCHRLDKALTAYHKALDLKKDWPELLCRIGHLHYRRHELGATIRAMQRAVELKPDYAEAYETLGLAVLGQGRPDEAFKYLLKAWRYVPESSRTHSNVIACQNYSMNFSSADILAHGRHWDKLHAQPPAVKRRRLANEPDPERRIRVGYLSPDFYTHPVSYFFESLLKGHDPEHIDVFCYADVAVPDRTTDRLKRLAPRWTPVNRMTDTGVMEQIIEDRIDILVDLSGHTKGHRLHVFAMKPAPIQVSYLGYPNTTGLSAMDYRLTDDIADPPGVTDDDYTEMLIRLPEGFLCYTPPETAPQPSGPPCLKNGFVTFGSFNNTAKVNDDVVRTWALILTVVPHSRIMMKFRTLVCLETRRRYLHIFGEYGIEKERVIFVDHIPTLEDHLALYGHIDIALDPFPYNGTTTTCEAMWQGAPIVTLTGHSHAGRVGASLLNQIGLGEMAASDIEEYLAMAVLLAGDEERLIAFRKGLRERMSSSSLCDAPRFTRTVENTYRLIWRHWCATGPR
jgi:protein O-GlcNAc transferase